MCEAYTSSRTLIMTAKFMNDIHPNKPALPYQIKLYIFIGEALCCLQLIEDSLSHYLVLKLFGKKINKEEADKKLKNNREKKTLGNAVDVIKKKKLFPEIIQNKLSVLLDERNWLVHRIFHEINDDLDEEPQVIKLYERIKSIQSKSHELINLIDGHMIEYSKLNGIDMTRVIEKNKEYYSRF